MIQANNEYSRAVNRASTLNVLLVTASNVNSESLYEHVSDVLRTLLDEHDVPQDTPG